MTTLGAYLADLQWLPVEDYDRQTGVAVLVLGGEGHWAPGYFGFRTHYPNADRRSCLTVHDLRPCWRHARDHADGDPLDFEPIKIAVIADKWRAAFLAD